MSLESFQTFISQAIDLLAAFDIRITLLVLGINFVGEVTGIFVPYLLETIWLMAGYQFSHGEMPVLNLLLLLAMAQLGRQIGALALYGISLSSSRFLARYKNRFKMRSLFEFPFYRRFKNKDLLRPWPVTVGRLLWVRIPLTLMLGARHKLGVLIIAVAVSSLIYDAIYLAMGALFGTTTQLKPTAVLLYSLVGVTIVYGTFFIVRRIIIRVGKWKNGHSETN